MYSLVYQLRGDENCMGLIYSMNDMFLCIGFTLGPIVGPAVQQAFGNGTALI